MFSNINKKSNITFCGMMGSGKSSIGKIIAKKINYEFIDIDRLIEKKEKKSISKIFRENGEKYFRILEEKTTVDILQQVNVVISLGGGAITNSKIRNSIKKNSYNIYLNTSIDILSKRLKYSKSRPLIKKKDLIQTLTKLIEDREKFYLEADFVIKNEISINHTISKIMKKISND